MLAEQIKALRAERGLSQKDLAERLHVVRQTISKWEKGLSSPDADMLPRLADALGTTPTVLLGTSTPASDVTPLALKAKLDAIQEGLEAQKKRRQKAVRIALLLLGIAATLALAFSCIGDLHAYIAENSMSADPSIIGGTDAPTQIFLGGGLTKIAKVVLLFGIAAGAFLGAYRSRRS